MISSSNDDTVCVFDCEKGEPSKTLHAKKYGASHIKFVHSGALSAICASRNEFDHSLRYWDLYENKYVRYFKGHISDVTSLDVHPYEDLFITSSMDRTTLLWDLRKEKPVGRIASRRTPASAFDNQGLVFSVSAGDQKLHLFDTRSFDKGEFTFFDLSRFLNDPADIIAKVDFSPCGKYILCITDSGKMLTVDSFKGNLVGVYNTGYSASDIQPSFSPDSQYIACGTREGPIGIFRTVSQSDDPHKTTPLLAKLEGHSGFPRSVMFNPTRCMLASACINVALWIPRS